VSTVEKRDLTSSYWDQAFDELNRSTPLDAWRDYMHRVYSRLMDCWLPCAERGDGLKTDLFEEALSPHSLLPKMGPHSFGIDYSVAVVRAAQQRLQACGKPCPLIVGDLRQLPIRSSSLQYVLSGSSLDHFPHHVDIAVCLAELSRVMVPGGTAIFTFDNPHNPVIWLRNHLPFNWLKRAGLVPYYVGATYTREMARRELEAAGFEVVDITCVAHAPRAAAIALIAILERLRWDHLARAISNILDVFEKLRYLPTRYHTGYYIACHARKINVKQSKAG
jgi:SAM-dependent methyltransferase